MLASSGCHWTIRFNLLVSGKNASSHSCSHSDEYHRFTSTDCESNPNNGVRGSSAGSLWSTYHMVDIREKLMPSQQQQRKGWKKSEPRSRNFAYFYDIDENLPFFLCNIVNGAFLQGGQ